MDRACRPTDRPAPHDHTLTNHNPPTQNPKPKRQDLAFKLLPHRVDAGARAHHERAAGEEIDWVALAKGRHTYKERLQRGEVTALSSAGGAGTEEEEEHQPQPASASASVSASAAA